MSKPPLDFDMLVEMKEFMIEVNDKFTEEINALINVRIAFSKAKKIAEIAGVQGQIDKLKGLQNKSHNFVSFLKQYLEMKKEDK